MNRIMFNVPHIFSIFTITATLFRGHLFFLIFGNIIHMACCVFETDLVSTYFCISTLRQQFLFDFSIYCFVGNT